MHLPVVDLCFETKVWEAMRRRQQKSSIELLLVKVISNTKLVIIPQLLLGQIPGDFDSETETLDL